MANIIMLGPPGSGKGTQAERISKERGWPQISTGNILRQAVEAGTPLGIRAKALMDRGELVPDEVVDGIVAERLSRQDCRGGFILDGFPRDLEQAEALEKIAKIDVVFDISVPDKALIERLTSRRSCECGRTYHLRNNPPTRSGICDACGRRLRQREDDNEETVKRRLKVYHRQTEPLIGHYRSRGILAEINGEKGIEDVLADIYGRLRSIP
jgi:adenylate kinase